MTIRQWARRWTVARVLLTLEAWWELLRAAVLIRRTAACSRAVRDALLPYESAKRQADPQPVVAAVSRAGRFHFKTMHCLERSLALLWMLRRRGVAAVLRLGCRRRGTELDFHAWVVDAHDRPVGDTGEEDEFVPLQPMEGVPLPDPRLVHGKEFSETP